MYKQINRIYTNIFDKRIFRCWLLYNTLYTHVYIHRIPPNRACLPTHFMALTNCPFTQHSMRADGTEFSLMIQMEGNARPAAVEMLMTMAVVECPWIKPSSDQRSAMGRVETYDCLVLLVDEGSNRDLLAIVIREG